MDAIQLLIVAVALFGAGSVVSLFCYGLAWLSRVAAGLFGIAASMMGLLAVARAASAASSRMSVSDLLPFGPFVLQMDGLSTLMVGMICLLALAVSVYSISYAGHYRKSSVAIMGFFTNLFIAMMLLVVTVANGFYFLIFWEMMTLTSYFLVIYEGEKEESIQAGFLYMLVAHAGTALIMLSFFVFYSSAGSFDFDAFRQNQLPLGLRSLAFLLAFLGFGAKAGMVPLHIWLPRAHPAAPSPVSALLSGVMIKTAIYGILRFCVDILGAGPMWWGLLVLVFGGLSALLGVFYAMTERDVKRILAYSSVENIGIILLGVGTGMIGLATGQPIVTVLGFLAALYHAVNHSLFKGLLFLGAGSMDFRLHTRDLNVMGGLGRLMPWTGATFLVGALGLSAIPPLNGFVSEWFTYQSFFAASGSRDFIVRAALPLCAVLLALTGALAAMVAIKMYGSAFVGPPRSEPARNASEVPGAMVIGMTLLAVGCVLLGLGAPLVAPYLVGVLADSLRVPSMAVAAGVWVYPAQAGATVLSTPLAALILLGLLSVPVALVAIGGGRRVGSRRVSAPWACGYGYSSRMSVTATSYDQPVVSTFSAIYLLRSMTRGPLRAIGSWSSRAREVIAKAEPILEGVVRNFATETVEYAGTQIQRLQTGDLRMYCLYIVITLAVLLIVVFR
jgi:hydrogenase-4 component B